MLFHSSKQFTLYNGNSKQILPTLAENSIDSIVCDPPYELGFMGKSWDSTGIANDVDLWKEVLRVLKPGGHLLAFSGSRTYHRMVVAIEDAGFEIRDQIMWVYGSGFPKSHNISKGIDKAAGAEREIVGRNPNSRENATKDNTLYESGTVGKTDYITKAATASAQQWQGWGTALKPAHEPIVLARKPFTGTVANNVLTYGTGGINIDGNRVGSEGGTFKASIPEGISNGIYGEGINGTVDIGKLDSGRWPANFIHDGSDEVVALFPDSNGAGGSTPNVKVTGYGDGIGNGTTIYTPNDRKEFNSGSGSAARFFYCAKAGKRDRNEGLDIEQFPLKNYTTANKMGGESDTMLTGSGNPRDSRKQNHHPTVKPTDLMQYLCRLITPPGGTILDPFLGSGSTGKAAMYEGFKFIGIELTEEYLPIAKARIEFALANLDEKLF